MHVELIDRLRCTAAHEDSWLVAAATETVDRHIISGVLGCPVCGAEYSVIDGAVWYSKSAVAAVAATADVTGVFDADDAVRLAALIGLDERGGLYALQGSEARFSDALEQTAPVQFMLIDPPGDVRAPAVIRGVGERLPLAAGSLRGIAVESASEAFVNAAALALGPQGRLVAPAAAPVPAGITVLARDNRQWVGESGVASSPPVLLRRSRS